MQHKLVALLTMVVAGLGIAAAGCGRDGHAPAGVQKAAAPVAHAPVATAEKTPLSVRYEAIGTVTAASMSIIQSKAVGHVTALHVKEGSVVEAGALLAEIDAREPEAMVQKAEGGVQEAQRALEEVGQSALAADAARAAAEAQLALAQSTYDRYKALADKQAVSTQVLDEASAKLKAATAELNRATETANAFVAKKAEASARAEQARAEVANVRAQLSHTQVTAPFGGVITAKHADVGDLASPGIPLLTLEDNHRFRVETLVDEAHGSLLKTGAAATVRVESMSVTLEGTVAEVVPKADPTSRTFIVKVDLPEYEGMRSGMFGRVTFSLGESETLTVPRGAVFERGQLTCVYVVNEAQEARLRLIKTGKTYGERTEVLSGLNAGEVVVAADTGQVADGNRIEPPAAQ